ncbi:unnamed protein product, partial [Linum tenue]
MVFIDIDIFGGAVTFFVVFFVTLSLVICVIFCFGFKLLVSNYHQFGEGIRVCSIVL